MIPAGTLSIIGRLTEASNQTFLAEDEETRRWVYKPVAGERPLWDFPVETLSRREVAAFAVSQALGVNIVPPTVWIEGPLGPGSAQLWIDGERSDLVAVLRPEQIDDSWLPVMIAEDVYRNPVVLAHRDDSRLRTLCLFDLIINNSDRKGAHILSEGERILGVDHGVCFHTEAKTRTILWGFAGMEFDAHQRALLHEAETLGLDVPPGLTSQEWQAVSHRATAMLRAGRFPEPSDQWPAIPWPPL